ncbi:MAG: protein-disulfide reductase DsbD domain-containing protein [Acidobacteriota bacterium]
MTVVYALLLLGSAAVAEGTADKIVWVHLPGDAQVAAGRSVEVKVSVAVAEGYHLQANPPSHDYLIPTQIKLEPAPDVTIAKVAYPPGKAYRLEGTDDDLQTLDGKFTIVISLNVSDSAAAGRRILRGRLHYQACNEKTCFFPASVPVTLSINVVPARKEVTASPLDH